MSDLPLHAALVHLPIALAVIVPLVALGVVIAWWRNALPQRAWWIVAGLHLLLVGTSIAALRTGEAEEERVEQFVAEQAIETHEERAEVFTWVAGLGLVLLVAPGLIRSQRAAKWVATAATAGTLAVAGLGYGVGHAGGQLVYQHGAAQAWVEGAPVSVSSQVSALVSGEGDEHDEEDDD